MTYKSFLRLSFTKPPKTYISPSLPATTLAACPNLGNGFAFRNFFKDHGKGWPAVDARTPTIVEGESGGELGLAPFALRWENGSWPWAPEAGDVVWLPLGTGDGTPWVEKEVTTVGFGGLSADEVDSFLPLFLDQNDIVRSGGD